MKVGLQTMFQNLGDPELDQDAFQADLHLSCLSEPLAFDSVWGVEHHFSGYSMSPSVLQFLSFMAARTERVNLGSMVVVLPWHDPARIAGEIAQLDNLSDGRLILGVGRGLARLEFDAFRVPMDESRQRFVEIAGAVLAALERGYIEHEGTFYAQPRREIRPAPVRSFRGRAYAAAVSPESSRIMAELGLGVLIILQKPWAQVEDDLAAYRAAYLAVNGVQPPPTIVGAEVFCDHDEGRARELARRYIGAYFRSVVRHYELSSDHLAGLRGYEFYERMAESMDEHGVDSTTDFYVDLQVWGTPEQCYEKVLDLQARLGCDTFIGLFRYGDMPMSDAEPSLRLFAAEVLPRLHQLPPLQVEHPSSVG